MEITIMELNEMVQIAIAKGMSLEDTYVYIVEMCYEFDVELDIMNSTFINIVKRMFNTSMGLVKRKAC